MDYDKIYNYIKVNDALSTAGQPTAEQLRALAAEGFAAVVNLATEKPSDPPMEEASLVRSLGMTYEHIPVAWDNPRESDFETFERTLARLPQGKTLIHCAANFRVTAFYALYALKHLGWTEEQAEQFRATIWEGSDYPTWEQFIARMKGKIRESGKDSH